MMAIPMDRVSGSSVARRSCSLRWSASDVTSFPPRFSNGKSSRDSVETGVRSSAWSKITELRSKGRSSARSPSTVEVSADTGSAGGGVGGGSAAPSAEAGAGPSAPSTGSSSSSGFSSSSFLTTCSSSSVESCRSWMACWSSGVMTTRCVCRSASFMV